MVASMLCFAKIENTDTWISILDTKHPFCADKMLTMQKMRQTVAEIMSL